MLPRQPFHYREPIRTYRNPFHSVPPYGYPISPQTSSFTSLATKGIGGLSKTLTNVQQVLQAIQYATPMIQQYGPMIKNLPMMYQMLKAFKEMENEESTNGEKEKAIKESTDNEKENTISEEEVSDKKIKDEITNFSGNDESIEQAKAEEEKLKLRDGTSKPKLFI